MPCRTADGQDRTRTVSADNYSDIESGALDANSRRYIDRYLTERFIINNGPITVAITQNEAIIIVKRASLERQIRMVCHLQCVCEKGIAKCCFDTDKLA